MSAVDKLHEEAFGARHPSQGDTRDYLCDGLIREVLEDKPRRGVA